MLLKRPKGPFGNGRRSQKAAKANNCNEGNPTVMYELTTSSSSAVLGTLGKKRSPTYLICGHVLHIFPRDTYILQAFVSMSSPAFSCWCPLHICLWVLLFGHA